MIAFKIFLVVLAIINLIAFTITEDTKYGIWTILLYLIMFNI